jgi:hypothetical protein
MTADGFGASVALSADGVFAVAGGKALQTFKTDAGETKKRT